MFLTHQLGDRRCGQPGPATPKGRVRKVGGDSEIQEQAAVVVGQRSYRYTTQITGRYARAVFRNEARVIEVASYLIERTKHPQLTLWVAWHVINADDKIADDAALLMRHLTRLAHDRHDVVDTELAEAVEIDPESVWHRISAESGDLGDPIEEGTKVAEIDGKINASERRSLVNSATGARPPPPRRCCLPQ